MPSEYRQLTLDPSQNYFTTTSYALYKLISASLSIQSSSRITQQNSLFNLFLSTLSMADCFISHIDVLEPAIRVTSSNLNMTSTSISRISDPDSYDFIFLTLDSTLTMNSLIFEDSTSNLFNARNTRIQINDLIIQNVASYSNLIRILSSNDIVISQYQSSNTSSSISEQILITDSSNVRITDFDVHDTPELIIDIINSNVTSLSDIQIHNCLQPIYLQNSKVEALQNSNFTNNGNSLQRFGGSVYVKDSDATIQNSTFINNTGIDGGAIHFSCTSTQNCNLTLTDVTLDSNNATRRGGALYYDFVRPSLNRVKYNNNDAAYGQNIASYPVKIKLVNSTQDDISFENVGSGVIYPQTLYFGLYDYDDQILVIENINQIIISAIDTQTSSVSGFNAQKLNQGIAEFDNIAFVATPGSTNILYQASSKAIDDDKIQQVFGQPISDNTININFRYCQPGEIVTNENQCQECSAGTYSLDWNSTECKNCIDDAVCNGKEEISVDPEHWRRTSNSTKIVR